MSKLTHIDATGEANMVDVGAKAVSERVAVATGRITMEPATLQLIQEGGIKKGDVFSVARIAGIMGAKRTSDLIPLCHPLPITSAKVTLDPDTDNNAILITATVKVTGKTGVEMEALTAVSVAALTIYDMAKAVDKDMVIGDIKLMEKEGGKSGVYKRGTSKEKNTPALSPRPVGERARVRGPQKSLAQDEASLYSPHAEERASRRTGKNTQSSQQREAFQHFVRRNNLRITSWAKDAGVPSGQIFGYLNGVSPRLSADTANKLAAALNMKTEDLFAR